MTDLPFPAHDTATLVFACLDCCSIGAVDDDATPADADRTAAHFDFTCCDAATTLLRGVDF